MFGGLDGTPAKPFDPARTRVNHAALRAQQDQSGRPNLTELIDHGVATRSFGHCGGDYYLWSGWLDVFEFFDPANQAAIIEALDVTCANSSLAIE